MRHTVDINATSSFTAFSTILRALSGSVRRHTGHRGRRSPPPLARISAQSEFKRKKILLVAAVGFLSILGASQPLADNANGKNLYLQRCSVCHGADIKGTGPLATKSKPSTPDLTNAAFKKRLNDYPGVIVSSIILRPNGDLIPKTLRENGVSIPPHAWSVKDLRDLHQYMSGVIQNNETANYQRDVQP
jgi:mono/diheme cytochrome c family protein